MRFFEVLLIFLSAIVLSNASLPLARRQNIRNLLLFSGVIFGVHLIIEGYRWQMWPVYLLLAFLFLSREKQFRAPPKLALLFWWALAVFLPVSVPVPNLPSPSGPFSVGTVIYHWSDSTRAEWFTEDPSDIRELMVQFWYPANEQVRGSRAAYLDHVPLRARAVGERVGLPALMIQHLKLVKSHSREIAPPADRGNPFPLLIFSHGLGGMKGQNTILMEELASHGYVVVAMDHPFDANMTVFPATTDSPPDGHTADYRSAIPDGTADSVWLQIRNRQLETRIADVQFVIARTVKAKSAVRGHINFGKIGILGHSFGGATAVLTAMRDDRIKAVAALDGWFVPFALTDEETKLNVPFLYIGQEAWPSWNEKRHRHYLRLLKKNSSGNVFHIAIEKSRHYDFADIPYFSPLTRVLGLTGFPSGRQMVKIVNEHSLAFFDRHLRGTELPFPPDKADAAVLIIAD